MDAEHRLSRSTGLSIPPSAVQVDLTIGPGWLVGGIRQCLLAPVPCVFVAPSTVWRILQPPQPRTESGSLFSCAWGMWGSPLCLHPSDQVLLQPHTSTNS